MFSRKSKKNILMSDIDALKLPPVVESVSEEWMINYLESREITFSHFGDPVFPEAKFHFIFDNHEQALNVCHMLNLVGYRAVPDAQFAIVYRVYNDRAFAKLDASWDIGAYESINDFDLVREMCRRYFHKNQDAYVLLNTGVYTRQMWGLYTDLFKTGQVLGRIRVMLEEENNV